VDNHRFFDFDNNHRIIEHWDVISAYPGSTISGRTAMDGSTEIRDLDKTAENKQLIRDFIEEVLMKGGESNHVFKYIFAEQDAVLNKEAANGLDRL
jgi:predicted SnoaL-like aldol condensation-catalyzing enzyme